LKLRLAQIVDPPKQTCGARIGDLINAPVLPCLLRQVKRQQDVPMILVALGGNLDSPDHGAPRAILTAALAAFASHGVTVAAQSRWYRTAPVPTSDQPWFVNLVIRVETALGPIALLAALQAIEHEFGRVRGARNAARILDIDLIDYDGCIVDTPALTLPHPRLAARAFVLLPLRDVVADWCDPRTGRSIDALISALPADQAIEVVE
jgi:2-amino-4-hydroxy-6-hydroxymethyldihydropteridine diphosphokinase